VLNVVVVAACNLVVLVVVVVAVVRGLNLWLKVVVVPVDVAVTSNLNWSAALTRAPLITFVSRMEANRTANIAPWRPPPTSVVCTVVGLVDPTI
jgi:hypothetical protein